MDRGCRAPMRHCHLQRFDQQRDLKMPRYRATHVLGRNMSGTMARDGTPARVGRLGGVGNRGGGSGLWMRSAARAGSEADRAGHCPGCAATHGSAPLPTDHHASRLGLTATRRRRRGVSPRGFVRSAGGPFSRSHPDLESGNRLRPMEDGRPRHAQYPLGKTPSTRAIAGTRKADSRS